jgi:hypothetical protein
MCTFFFFISIDHHNDLQMPPDRAISFVNSPLPLSIINLNNHTEPLHLERSNYLKTSLKSSKSHFRWLRFDQNNSGLMSGPDSISDPIAHKISYTGSYPSARGSAPTRLGSTQPAADDVAGGSHCADVSADWTLTWHAYCAC